jgi:H+/Cl- antiporter ClcA
MFDRLKRIDFRNLFELQLEIRPQLQGMPYWTAAAIVGLVAVLYSGTFTAAITASQAFFVAHPYSLFVLSPFCFFLATWIVERFAPPAGGTGVPTVVRALSFDPEAQKTEIDSYLNLRVAVVVAASSILCVFGAGSLGREGPMVHIAACMFYFTGRQFDRLWPYTEHRSWIVAGGAAGVAAAFNAPLAGVVFVLEELAQQQFHQFKTVVISAAIIGGMVSQWLSGKYLFFSYPAVESVPLDSFPWAILVGVICGMVAYPFQRILKTDFRKRLPSYLNTKLKFAVLMGFCMASIAVFVNPGSIGGGTAVIEALLFKNEEATWSLIFARFAGTIISHLSGCAGGFLAPSLALGAAIGSKLAVLTHYSNPHLLVLVGMSAFLSANLRAPFTAWVIVMEMTDRHQAIFPLMVASLTASGTIRYLLERKKVTPKTPE